MKARHLQEERLFDCYLAATEGDILDPPVAEHLIDCDECAARYAELTAFMETLRTEGAADADAVFSPERLRTQRMHINRRIEHLGHPARVITFPGRTSGRQFGSSIPRPARRWVAAAAAAGLFVGVGTGLFLDREGRGTLRRPPATITRQAVLTTSNGRIDGPRIDLVRPESFESDQAFLSELELAGERPRIRELIAVDALTPHVREVNLR